MAGGLPRQGRYRKLAVSTRHDATARAHDIGILQRSGR
jgi:hypothetical protein